MKNHNRVNEAPESDSLGWMFGVFLALAVLAAGHHGNRMPAFEADASARGAEAFQ